MKQKPNNTRNAGRKQIYGEETETMQFKIPISKRLEIKAKVRAILKEYLVILILFIFAGCSLPENPARDSNELHVTQQPVSSGLIGTYTNSAGTIQITSDSLTVRLTDYNFSVPLADKKYTVLSNPGCYLIIVIDGIEYKISDWVWYNGTVRLYVGVKYVATLNKIELPAKNNVN